MDPICILSDKLEGNGYIFCNHHSALVLDAAHKDRSGGSLRCICTNLDSVSLVICVPECGACDSAEDRQDQEGAPFPHKHVDRNSDTDHRENLGHRGYSEEARASVPANQARHLPPVHIAVDRVTGGVEVGWRSVAEHLEGDARERGQGNESVGDLALERVQFAHIYIFLYLCIWFRVGLIDSRL